MPSNLPPGVTSSMIPGNDEESAAWERFYEAVDKDAAARGMNAEDAAVLWRKAIEARDKKPGGKDTPCPHGSGITSRKISEDAANVFTAQYRAMLGRARLPVHVQDSSSAAFQAGWNSALVAFVEMGIIVLHPES